MSLVRALAGALLVACGGSPPGDGPTHPAVDADASAAVLERLADDIMWDSFDGTASELGRCIGGVTAIVTPTSTLVRGYGAVELGGAIAPDARTLFQIGSISKVVTGLGLARLVVDDGVSPETPVDMLLAGDLRAVLAPGPTLVALATHHAGLPSYPDNLVDRDGDDQRDPGIDWRSPATGYARAHLATFLDRWQPPVAPAHEYSNLGLGLLGVALQDHLGLTSRHDALTRLVFRDLDLTDTVGEVALLDEAARARVASGNAVDGGRRVPGVLAEMGVLSSAGEIVSSGADMAKFLGALTGTRATPLDGAIALALRPVAAGPGALAMGYGIEVETRSAGTVFRKAGTTSSFSAYVVFAREPPVGVVVLTSCGAFSHTRTLADALFDGVLAQVGAR